MHVDEVAVDAALVGRLLAEQFPRWAGFPLEPVRSAGTDNVMFRLGADMVVRVPRLPDAALQVNKERWWLPRVAPLLPLAVPTPFGNGMPGANYPWPWAIYRWIEGQSPTVEQLADDEAAHALGRFVAALQRIEPSEQVCPGKHNSFRGAPLASRDAETRAAIQALHGHIDTRAATEAWEAALAAPPWQGAPVWIHGDLLEGNLLVRGGRLSAVIDFGCLGVGDPACDVMAAWTVLSQGNRETFRVTTGVDEATWARGRGWALSFGLIALPYYWASTSPLARIASRAVDEVLADYRRGR